MHTVLLLIGPMEFCRFAYNWIYMKELRDEFLSEEDLDLKNLSWEELLAYWDIWLKQAQLTNDIDKNTYSHGVFTGLKIN